MSAKKGIVSFVSETEAEEVRKKRQEEWEKVRQPDDPIERPEEVNDTRSLYEKLQEQKDKKQEEWEEQHKFKNMIRGLEGDETEFLDEVARQQQEINKRRYEEDSKEIKGFRSAVSELQESTVINTKSAGKKVSQVPAKKSQMDLIAGAIKRRKSSSSSDTTPEKKAKSQPVEDNTKTSTDNTTAQPNSSTNNNSESEHSESTEDHDRPKKVLLPRYRVERYSDNMRPSKTIPGLGIYSDSSDSESSSSDSEILTTNPFVRHR